MSVTWLLMTAISAAMLFESDRQFSRLATRSLMLLAHQKAAPVWIRIAPMSANGMRLSKCQGSLHRVISVIVTHSISEETREALLDERLPNKDEPSRIAC